MIDVFKKIGEKTIEGRGRKDSFNEKKEILKAISSLPQEKIEIKKGKKSNHPIIINFNSKNNSFEIYIEKQINLRENDYFIFDKGSGANAKKIFFGTNNITYHWNLTIPDMIKFIEEDLGNDKKYKKFKDFLINIKDNFYYKYYYLKKENSKKEEKYFLNIFKMKQGNIEDLKEKYIETIKNEDDRKKIGNFFENIKDGKESEIAKEDFDDPEKNFNKNIQKIYEIFLKEKNWFNFKDCFILYFDGKPIQETEYGDIYKEIVYFAKIHKNFVKDGREGVCHICNNNGIITGKIDIPTKFYMTDKPGFFENLDKNKSYKSFSICENCYKKTLVGISYIKNFSRVFSFSGIPFYIIPYGDNFFKDTSSNFEYLSYIIDESFFGNLKNLEQNTENQNFLFDLLFYQPSRNSDFKILKHIQNISSIESLKIKDILDSLNSKEFESGSFFKNLKDLNKYRINLGSSSYLLFNESYLNPKKDKDKISFILDILEAVYSKYPRDIENFLKFYLESYKKQYFKNKKNKNPFDSKIFRVLLYLKFLYERGVLKNRKMEIHDFIKSDEIDNEKLKEFFVLHEELDEVRKGLIALGTVINNILNEQFKQKKSKTFMNKVDFDGIDKKDLLELVNDIEEYLNFYSIDYNNKTKTFAFEIASKIHSNKSIHLSPQEITFYILLGINLGRYIASSQKLNKINEND